MNNLIFLSLIIGFQIFYWTIGRYSAKKISGIQDYFLAGRKVKLFPLTMTFFATQVGGGNILGAADEAFLHGWSVLLYPLGTVFGLILLGLGIGGKLAGFKVTTVAQIFEVVYRSSKLKKVASILSVISLFMILIAQIIASKKFFISIGFDNTFLFILLWAIVGIYTIQGGLKAVISTDMAQAVVFSLIFLFSFLFILYSNPSIAAFKLPQIQNFVGVYSKLTGWLLMPLLFIVIEQDMGQRCFAGDSKAVVSKASLLSGVLTLIICFVPIFIGTFAKSIGLEISPGESVLMITIIKTTTPWISSLVGCAVLAVIISTATSLINAICSNISSDFKLSNFRKIESLALARGITLIISMGAIFFAFYFNNIVDLLIQSYELSVSCLFVPIFIGLFKNEGKFISALLSILLGALGFFLFRVISIEFPKEIAALFLSLSGYICGEIISYYRAKIIINNS